MDQLFTRNHNFSRWLFHLVIIGAHYFLSVGTLLSMRRYADITEMPGRINCGMPLLGMMIALFVLSLLTLAVLFIRMYISKSFIPRDYLLTAIVVQLPAAAGTMV